jgi:hypothetical protein
MATNIIEGYVPFLQGSQCFAKSVIKFNMPISNEKLNIQVSFFVVSAHVDIESHIEKNKQNE